MHTPPFQHPEHARGWGRALLLAASLLAAPAWVLAAGPQQPPSASAPAQKKDAKATPAKKNDTAKGDPAAPFGGFKASGVGREHGREGLNAYLENKTVWINLS